MPWTYPKSQPSRGTTLLVVSLHVVELLLLVLEAGGLFPPPFFLLLKTCSPSLCLVCFVNFTRTLKGLGSTSDASRLLFCWHHINPFSFPFRSFLLLLLYTMRSQQLRPDQLVWPPRPLFFWYSVVVLPCPLSDFLLKPVLFFFFYLTFFAS